MGVNLNDSPTLYRSRSWHATRSPLGPHTFTSRNKLLPSHPRYGRSQVFHFPKLCSLRGMEENYGLAHVYLRRCRASTRVQLVAHYRFKSRSRKDCTAFLDGSSWKGAHVQRRIFSSCSSSVLQLIQRVVTGRALSRG